MTFKSGVGNGTVYLFSQLFKEMLQVVVKCLILQADFQKLNELENNMPADLLLWLLAVDPL